MRGTLVNAVAILLLDIKRLRVANLLPALLIVVLLTIGRRTLGW